MSLIQEALKRKNDENSGIAPKVIPTIPPAALELPVKQPELSAKPPAPPVRGKGIHAWPVLVVSLLVVVTLVLAAIGLLLYSLRSLVQGRQQTKAAHAAVAPMAISISTGIVIEGTTEKKQVPAEVGVAPVSPPVPLRLSWPRLKVVGVMSRAGVQDVTAIVDGNLAECGDEIRGVKVHGVDKSGVWFVFKNQTQFVRVGQTTL
jgi:hypothetical protein